LEKINFNCQGAGFSNLLRLGQQWRVMFSLIATVYGKKDYLIFLRRKTNWENRKGFGSGWPETESCTFPHGWN